jgi:hypothetical protein
MRHKPLHEVCLFQAHIQPRDCTGDAATFPTVTFSTTATLNALVKMVKVSDEERGSTGESN